MKPDITLPNRTGQGESETFHNESNIVIVGANGAGKSRLGIWIENNHQSKLLVHRISAHRALKIPVYAHMKNLEQAESGLFYGRDDQYGNVGQKISSRWEHNPETHLLDDFQHLLSTLFARTAKRDREHSIATKETECFIPVTDAPIDVIIKLWQDIMPHCEISFEDGKVTTRKEGEAEYHGKEMSDGERGALYLIGQCLCAPDDSIIIIDEPEIHLHKSLMTRLWNKIEEACPDKLLVFITHDLDFASSRKDAKKFWIKNFDGVGNWTWEEVPDIESIPENLVIEIVGSRKNIIFCEGEKTSYDSILYQAIYPDFHIVARGGCEKVIESTKAVRGTPSLHNLQAFGIIDSDYRTNEEISILQMAGIYTINVAEVENLFCIEPIIKIVASHLHLDVDSTVKKVTAFIIKCLERELDLQVTSRSEKEIRFRLNAYTKAAPTEQGLSEGMTSVISSINVAAIYQENRTLFQQAIDHNSLEQALKLYNSKNLHKRISHCFGLANGEYVKIVTRLLKSGRKEEMVAGIRNFTPPFVSA